MIGETGKAQAVSMNRIRYRCSIPIILVLMVAMLASCVGGASAAYKRGKSATERQLWDQAVLDFAKAVSLDPGNTRYEVALARAKLRSSLEHFERAKRFLANEQLELALAELQQAVVLDPSNEYALNELERTNETLERRRREPTEYDLAMTEAQRRAEELGPPKLDPGSNVPIVLNFPDSTVGDVYNTLSKVSGINFLYDDKLDKKKKTSVELANVTFEKAMDVLMLMHKHFYKVIDTNTILISEDSRPKRSEYEDQVIRTFYLSNAETKQVQTLLRSLLETRRIHENADLNAITIKDTPEKIKIAERIIKANDKAKGEVIVDLELLEINRTTAQTLGIDLSTKSLSIVFGAGNESIPLNNFEQLRNRAAWTIGPVPSVLLNFIKSDSDAQTIARPQLRILEGEDGKITIGDRVPIPATTFNTSQTIGGNIVPVTSFTYQNVGIIVNVKPRVHHNKEITVELQVEISSLAGEVVGTGGVSQPIIGTRTVETTLRLNDGETNLLAGLIKEEERTSLSGVPGLSEIPVLKRLFGTTDESRIISDIVLSVTPHIIRVPNIEPIDLVPLWVGTEERIELRGVARNALGESPFAGPSPWEEIERELNGEQVRPAEPGKVRVDVEPGDGDEPEPPRRRRDGGRTPEPVPDDEEPGEAAPADRRRGAPARDDEEREPVPPAQVRLVPDKQAVAPGDPLALDIEITQATNASTINFQLRYDPNVLQFVPPAETGEFLGQGGAFADLQAVESAEGGLIVVSVARSGPEGATGSGRLARLNFVALESGRSGFNFSAAQIRDPDSRPLPATFRTTSVEVAP